MVAISTFVDDDPELTELRQLNQSTSQEHLFLQLASINKNISRGCPSNTARENRNQRKMHQTKQ